MIIEKTSSIFNQACFSIRMTLEIPHLIFWRSPNCAFSGSLEQFSSAGDATTPWTRSWVAWCGPPVSSLLGGSADLEGHPRRLPLRRPSSRVPPRRWSRPRTFGPQIWNMENLIYWRTERLIYIFPLWRNGWLCLQMPLHQEECATPFLLNSSISGIDLSNSSTYFF